MGLLSSRRGLTGSRLVVLLGALSMFGPLTMDMYLPALPALTRDLSASTSAGQLTLTACMAGLAAGQLVFGPVSDAIGRRRPLVACLVVFVLASLGAVFASSIWVLLVLRLLQGLGGSAGIVIARAVVRDRFPAAEAAQRYALLTLVSSTAPIVAPVLGGLVLQFGEWRAIFVALAISGLLVLIGASAGIAESLAPERRLGGGLAETGRVIHALVRDRAFRGYVLAGSLAFAAMAAYIAGSPFVLQDVYGLSPLAFACVFAGNAVGIVALGRVNRRLVGRLGAAAMLQRGIYLGASGGVALLVSVLAGAGLVAVLVSLLAVVASIGLVLPNATALAMRVEPSIAGRASALIGAAQFGIGGLVAPLVGVAGRHSAVPMAIVVVAMGAGAIAALRSASARVSL